MMDCNCKGLLATFQVILPAKMTMLSLKPLSDPDYGRYCLFISLKMLNSEDSFMFFCSRICKSLLKRLN